MGLATAQEKEPDLNLLAFLPYLVAGAIFAVIAWPMLTWWSWEYTRPDSYYSHGPLIPFMAAFMIWTKRDRLKDVALKPQYGALVLLIPLLTLFVVAIKVEMRAISSLSFILVIWASVWLALGNEFMKRNWFPLAFLALMMPLPGPILNDATLGLQMTSTKLATKMLHLIGFTAWHYGNVIQMDDFTLFVDVPCSGFKTLLALMTFNAFLAYLLDGPGWKRVLLFVLCAPLALIVNALRIALIGVVGDCLGVRDAHIFHDYSGLITLILGFAVLFFTARVMGCRNFAGWEIF